MPTKRPKGKRVEAASSEVEPTEGKAINPPKRRRKQDDSTSKDSAKDKPKDTKETGKMSENKRRAVGTVTKRRKLTKDKTAKTLTDIPDERPLSKTKRKMVNSDTDTKSKKKLKIVLKPISANQRLKDQSPSVVIASKPISHFSHCNIPGDVLVMGQGDCGQLGLGESLIERKKPYPVTAVLPKMATVQVVCGGMHTVALTTEGKVYTWGCNDEGSLGYTVTDNEVFEPQQVTALDKLNIIQISAGDCHTVALQDNGNVHCWGVFRDSNGPFNLAGSAPTFEPKIVYSSPFNPAVKIVSGDNHVVILTEKGDIYTFGSGEQGQLGRIPEVFCSRGGRQGLDMFFTPKSVRMAKKRNSKVPEFCDIFAGSYTSYAVGCEPHCVYVWGLNNYGQLGTGGTDIKYYPELVPEDWLWSWGKGSSATGGMFISGGMHHTLVCSEGMVYSMGSKNYGRLGLGKTAIEPDRPTEVTSIRDVVKLACGGSCSFATTSKGVAYSWGMGSSLQLGQADDEDVWVPTEITGKNLGGKKVIGISCGGQHTALLVTDNAA